MITKEQDITKYCCLYVSDFHLEMILLPYIKNKIYKSKVIIFTEDDLTESLNILLERTNLNIEDKKEILNIKSWKSNNFVKQYKDNEEYTIVINGDNDYINKIHHELQILQGLKINVIDCYDINKVKINKKELQEKYDKFLNTESI